MYAGSCCCWVGCSHLCAQKVSIACYKLIPIKSKNDLRAEYHLTSLQQQATTRSKSQTEHTSSHSGIYLLDDVNLPIDRPLSTRPEQPERRPDATARRHMRDIRDEQSLVIRLLRMYPNTRPLLHLLLRIHTQIDRIIGLGCCRNKRLRDRSRAVGEGDHAICGIGFREESEPVEEIRGSVGVCGDVCARCCLSCKRNSEAAGQDGRPGGLGRAHGRYY